MERLIIGTNCFRFTNLPTKISWPPLGFITELQEVSPTDFELAREALDGNEAPVGLAGATEEAAESGTRKGRVSGTAKKNLRVFENRPFFGKPLKFEQVVTSATSGSHVQSAGGAVEGESRRDGDHQLSSHEVKVVRLSIILLSARKRAFVGFA